MAIGCTTSTSWLRWKSTIELSSRLSLLSFLRMAGLRSQFLLGFRSIVGSRFSLGFSGAGFFPPRAHQIAFCFGAVAFAKVASIAVGVLD